MIGVLFFPTMDIQELQKRQVASDLPTQRGSEAITSTVSSAPVGHEESVSLPSGAENASHPSQGSSQILSAFISHLDSLNSRDSAQAATNVDEQRVLEYANRVKHDLFSVLSAVVGAIAEENVGSYCPHWKDTLSLHPHSDLEACAYAIMTALVLTKGLLDRQWTQSQDDKTMLALTRALATASRERELHMVLWR